MRYALAMLVYNRPMHTALSLAYALVNKHADTDLHVFYSIHRYDKPPSKALDKMLHLLHRRGHVDLHYLHAERCQTCRGNVDTLMMTMGSDPTYDCFVKMDDDILIGPGAEVLLSQLLMSLEHHRVMLLMGQMVPQNVQYPCPFSWDCSYEGYRVVQQAHDIDPMETFAAVNPKLFKIMEDNEENPLCGSRTGNFSRYTRTMIGAGYRSATLIDPHLNLQHIGLTSCIRGGIKRAWAPATSWNHPDTPIQLEHFDFMDWEISHVDDTQKQVALWTIENLIGASHHGYRGALDLIYQGVLDYDPGTDVEPPEPEVEVEVEPPEPEVEVEVEPPEPEVEVEVEDLPEQEVHGVRIVEPGGHVTEGQRVFSTKETKRVAGPILRKLPDGRVVRRPPRITREQTNRQ